MKMTMKKIYALAAVAMFAVLGLTSCGGGGSSSEAEASDIPTDGLLGELPMLTAKYCNKIVDLREKMFSGQLTEDELKNAKILRTSGKSTLLTFLLFLIPGTPKDMLSYLVGLTDMKLHMWIAICAVGRFPAILLSTASGIELQQGRYGIFLFMLILTGVLSLGGLWFYHRRSKAVQEEDEEDSGPDRGDRDRRQRPEARPERDLT